MAAALGFPSCLPLKCFHVLRCSSLVVGWELVMVWPLTHFLKRVSNLVDILLIDLALHPLHEKQLNCEPIYFSPELILCVRITIGRADFNWDSAAKILAPSFEHPTFQPRFSSLWPFSWLRVVGPIHVTSTLGDHFPVAASKLSGTLSRFFRNQYV